MNAIDKSLKTGLTLTFSAILACFTLISCQKFQNSGSGVQSEILSPAQDVVVAKINGAEVLYSDVRRIAVEQGLIKPSESLLRGSERADFAPMEAAAFNAALESLISQKLIAKDGQRKNLHKTPEAKRRFSAARERILSSLRVEAHIRETVTEAAIRELYDSQVALADFGDEIHARHIVVETEEDALKLMEKLEDGSDFEALAADMSLDKDTRDRGGSLGYFTQDMLSPEFNETAKGWHIAEILDRRRPDAQSYEDSREALRNFLTFDAIENLTRDLRQEGKVKLIPVVDAPESSDK